MLSYGAYAAITFGSISVIILIGFIILFKLPLRKLVVFLEYVFRFKEVRNIDDNYIIIDVCDDKFELTKGVFSRLPFIIALNMCLLVIIIIFIEGCVFSTRHVFADRSCLDRTPNCYLFKTRLTTFTPFYQYVCEPDELVIPANISATYAVCYGYVLPDQSSIDILNQLGVCTGILSMVESLYPLAYKFARQRYGRIVLILLVCALVVIEIVALTEHLNISFMTVILITMTEVLLCNILVLHYRKIKNPAIRTRLESYIELN